ncbi:putative glycosyltransferase [uncultured Gammaproteobacteria bacterium]|jgi:glycosyltransferase involved in cell wall biosynthesis|nr:Putative glycosyltransferase [uncultured Gammaproteobacteria bacterium]VVH51029.1 putative glycosyltransferase [uncultured Gammaproteobacteria bacterium]
MKFSVLISIYYKEEVQSFNRAMQSVWDEQTVKPNEVVLVEDGPLTDGLYQAIREWKERLTNALQVVSLKENVGVGAAKNIGIEMCNCELIAVMDTDDVSLPKRFEKQLAVFENQDVDVCGAWIGEFELNETQIISYRRTPEQHNEIVAFAKGRSPVNHVTAMYKKSWVLNVGNYAKYRTSEDYNLFVKLIMAGAKIYNLQESLVSVRMGNEQQVRRGGLKNAMFEADVQVDFYKMGFLNFFEMVRNVSVGFVIRMLPSVLMKVIFKMIRKL